MRKKGRQKSLVALCIIISTKKGHEHGHRHGHAYKVSKKQIIHCSCSTDKKI